MTLNTEVSCTEIKPNAKITGIGLRSMDASDAEAVNMIKRLNARSKARKFSSYNGAGMLVSFMQK